MAHTKDHPQRVGLSELMHLRSLPIEIAPVRIRQSVLLVDSALRQAEMAATRGLAPDQDPGTGRVARVDETGGVIWERHQEFSTWTVFELAPLGSNLGFSIDDHAQPCWPKHTPGLVFREVEIVVSPKGADEPNLATLSTHIDVARAVSCDVFDGAARIWTDFRLHKGGAGRIFVQNRNLSGDEVSRLCQTLLEIGNYRKLALLGFNQARELLTWLDQSEARLAQINSALAQGADSQTVLDQLLALSAEVELRAADGKFRRGATASYHQLTLDRLEALRETRVAGHSTMREFIGRRLLPAMRTCQVADRRLDDLSVRIGRSGDLLRARLGMALDRQNQASLSGMHERLRLQTKLQTLVEGLSIFAVGYYVVGLLSYALKPWLHDVQGGPERVISLLVPCVLLIVSASIHHRKKRLTAD
jgi:uncharacterized membrane-anchored protein